MERRRNEVRQVNLWEFANTRIFKRAVAWTIVAMACLCVFDWLVSR